MQDDLPSAVWAKLDLMLDKIQKIDLAVARIEGDNKLQGTVLQHVTATMKEFKDEITHDVEELEKRVSALEKWQVRLAAIGSAVVAIFVFFGDNIKQALGIHHG